MKMKLYIIAIITLQNILWCFGTPAAPLDSVQLRDLLDTLYEGKREILSRIADSDDELPDVLRSVNAQLGSDVFKINEDSVSLSPEEICELLRNKAGYLIGQIFKNNSSVQSAWLQSIHGHINTRVRRELETALEDTSVSLREIRDLARREASLTPSRRYKRDILSDILKGILQTMITNLLTPIKSQVVTILEGLKSVLTSLIVANSTETNVIFQVGISVWNSALSTVVNLITSFVENIDYIFSYISNLTDTLIGDFTNSSSSSSRRKRYAETYLDVETDLVPLHRSKRDLSSLLGTLLSNILNTIIKTLLSEILSPVQTWIDNIFVTVEELISSLTIDTSTWTDSNVILEIVVGVYNYGINLVKNFVVKIQSSIDGVFVLLIGDCNCSSSSDSSSTNSTSTDSTSNSSTSTDSTSSNSSSSRRKRDAGFADSEFIPRGFAVLFNKQRLDSEIEAMMDN